MLHKEDISNALRRVQYPGFSRDIVSFGLVREISIKDRSVTVSLSVTTGDPRVPHQLKRDVERTLQEVDGVRAVEVEIAATSPKTPSTGLPQASKIDGVEHIIAVASGKGGVGKSTFAVNLACAFEQQLATRGHPGKVGIMDCDIHGPTVPLMIGINDRPDVANDRVVPLENFGVRVMSMGFLLDEKSPVVWRGPMVTRTIVQFIKNVSWGKLQFLVVDLPPGTGDAQLTLAQTVVLSGAIIVTTPQAASVNVARRGATMFSKVNVPFIGVAENMSYLEDPVTGGRSYLFGSGGGLRTARDLQTEFLGQVPLDPDIREGGDRGVPVVCGLPNGRAAQSFRMVAERVLRKFLVW